MKFFIIIILPIILFFILIFVFRFLKSKKKGNKRKTEVSFVVDTFYTLVRELKNKEEELNVLRQKAEQRADEVESYSENILQSVPAGVVSFDNRLIITKVNNAASNILKIPSSEMIGIEYNKIFQSPLKELIKSEQSLKTKELKYKNSKGQEIWLDITKTPLFNKEGRKIGQILIFTDITDVKSLEYQVRLREHLTSLGELSLGIAHELRNPMAVISGYLKMLLKRKDVANTPEIKAILKEIQIMDRIINEFMYFAKPVEPTFSLIDVEDMLKTSVQHCLKKQTDIKIEYKINQKYIKTDEILFRQAVINLIQNAIDAMPSGGKLKIITEKVQEKKFILKVSDTGYGIAEDIKDKIFQPFFSKKEKGLGLGLAIAHKNITLINGTLKFESSDKGTTFIIEIPSKLIK